VFPESRLLRITHDDYLHVTYRLAELRDDPPKDLAVYYFGGSGAMEAIVSERSFEAALERAGGGDVTFVSLAAHAQSFGQTIAIVENLPDGAALLLVGLAPMRFTTAPEEDGRLLSGKPLPLESSRLAALLGERYGMRPSRLAPLPGVFDYATNYVRARTLGETGLFEAIEYEPHYYDGSRPPASADRKRGSAAEEMARDAELYELHGAYNLAALEELLRLAAERGFEVVLYEQPLNVAAGEESWGGVLAASRREAERLAARRGAVYLPMVSLAPLGDDAFADLYHLVPEARRRWQAALAGETARCISAAAAASAQGD
jgi:hypothetical protein